MIRQKWNCARICTASSLLLFAAHFGLQGAQLKTALTVTDSSRHSTVITFGVDASATRCIDPSLGEFELPPGGCSSTGLCVAFKDVHADTAACLGEGLLLDLRGFYSSTQVDTYRVVYSFQNYPVVFHWDSSISSVYDSVRIVDEIGGLVLNREMLAGDSMVVSAPLVSTFFIVAYGPKLVTTGAELPALFPQSAQLSQNYPNPFNPRTMIRYSLAEPGFVSVEVYDMLGTRVSTLVSRFEQAGDFQVEWDAEDQPSGVYFCRLQTARYILTRSMLLVR